MGVSILTSPANLTTREVLKLRATRRLWYALIVSSFGDFLALFAVISVVSFQMHAAVEQITWVQIAALLPIVLMGPLAGVFVDRWPLKSTLVLSDIVRAALTLLLLIATHLWQLYLILALMSAISGFFGPAQQCTIRITTPPEGLVATNILMQQAIFVLRVVSPAVASLLIALFGVSPCYLIDTLSFIGSALIIGSITIRQKPPTKVDPLQNSENGLCKLWFDMRIGFNFILDHSSILFVILSLAAAVFTLGCFAPLIAIYVRESLHSTSTVFGLASSMIGAGILVGFFAVRQLSEHFTHHTLVFSGLGGMAAGLLLLNLVSHTSFTFAAAFLIGFSVAGILLSAQTLIQQETPEELFGRVSSTAMSIVFGAQMLGLLLSGVLAQLVGVRTAFLVNAIVLVGIVMLGSLSVRRKITNP